MIHDERTDELCTLKKKEENTVFIFLNLNSKLLTCIEMENENAISFGNMTLLIPFWINRLLGRLIPILLKKKITGLRNRKNLSDSARKTNGSKWNTIF